MKTNHLSKSRRNDTSRFSPPSSTSGGGRTKRTSRVPVNEAELNAWIQRAKDLPDIRWDKVKAMREAIQNHAFDSDDRLIQLADKLPTELIEYFRQVGR